MTFSIIEGNSAEILKQFPDNHFDSIVTDPPYLIDFLGKAWDSKDNDLTPVFKECLRVIKPGGHILAFSAARTYHHLAITLEQAGFEIRDQIMWIQSNGFPKSTQHLKPAHEPICLAKKKGRGFINIEESKVNGKYPSNVIGEIPDYQKYFYCPKVSRRERHLGHDIPEPMFGKQQGAFGENGKRYAVDLNAAERGNYHPTVKPIELMKYLIKLVTRPGGRVLDPFNGSGSTGCAAVELGYEYTGIELDPKYVEIARKRIEAWKNQTRLPEIFEYDAT